MEDVLVEEIKPNPPKEGMEYIYNLDMAWPIYDENDKREDEIGYTNPFITSKEGFDSLDRKPYSISIKEGLIVTDVVYNGSRYEFTIKEFGIRCRTNYAWAFWENTPENKIKIEKYRKEKRELEKQQSYTHFLLDKIDKIKE